MSLVLILDRVSIHPIVVKKAIIKQLLNWKREKKKRERERERDREKMRRRRRRRRRRNITFEFFKF